MVSPPMTYMAGGKQFVVIATGSGLEAGAPHRFPAALRATSMQAVSEFKVVADYRPAGDQPAAIAELVDGVQSGLTHQTLLGVTGSGKTFAVANVIAAVQRPTLVLAPNKTLAAQLYGEFREFFPRNAVEYFVSYYDYYQPEAYVPSSDTYIEKDASVNAHIEQMRLSATKALLERRDTVIVASVSAIYGLGDPQSYLRMVLHLDRGDRVDQRYVLRRLAELQYTRNDMAFQRGTYRVRGDVIDIFPAESEKDAVRVELFDDEIDNISTFDPLTGEVLSRLPRYTVFPKTHYVTPRERILGVIDEVQVETRRAPRRAEGGEQAGGSAASRTAHALRHGDDPRTRLLQRHRELFALPLRPRPRTTAADPVSTICRRTPSWSSTNPTSPCRRSAACTKATVRARKRWWSTASACRRPWTTGRCASTNGKRSPPRRSSSPPRPAPTRGNVRTPSSSRWFGPPAWWTRRWTSARPPPRWTTCSRRSAAPWDRGERVLVTTLTKRMAEDLTDYLDEHGVRVRYLHSDIDTVERMEIVRDLRLGKFDVLVGINLLREGLDMPEVSLVAILDADKEGFLRAERSLIQTIGRAARNLHGRAILYADAMTGSMQAAIDETNRRRDKQLAFNEEHGIVPRSVVKAVADVMEGARTAPGAPRSRGGRDRKAAQPASRPVDGDPKALGKLIADLEARMFEHAKNLEFEDAASVRDEIRALRETHLAA